MSQAASQAAAFYREVAEKRIVWTMDDEGGYPAPKTRTGRRSMPFWSSKSRVEKIIKTVPAYRGFTPIGFAWDDFVNEWVVDLKKDGYLVGVNWSGDDALGYDLEPEDVVANVTAAIDGRESPFRQPRG
jgi:hypothetical protein